MIYRSSLLFSHEREATLSYFWHIIVVIIFIDFVLKIREIMNLKHALNILCRFGAICFIFLVVGICFIDRNEARVLENDAMLFFVGVALVRSLTDMTSAAAARSVSNCSSDLPEDFNYNSHVILVNYYYVGYLVLNG